MAMQTDPVCGMPVDDQKTSTKSQYQGTNYYFCSGDCKRQFDQHPEQYADKQQQVTAQAKRSGSKR